MVRGSTTRKRSLGAFFDEVRNRLARLTWGESWDSTVTTSRKLVVLYRPKRPSWARFKPKAGGNWTRKGFKPNWQVPTACKKAALWGDAFQRKSQQQLRIKISSPVVTRMEFLWSKHTS